ncbi:MAG: type II secretion system F family protein [Bacillota bacterium]
MIFSVLIFCSAASLFLGIYAFFIRNPLEEAFQSSAGEAEEDKGLVDNLTDLFGSFVSAFPPMIKNLISMPNLNETLKIAGWRIGSEEFLGIRVMSSVTMAMLFAIPFGHAWWLGGGIGAFIGYILPVSLLAKKVNTIGFKLQQSTPLFLGLFVAGIKSGQSIEEAMAWAAKIDDHLFSEIQRVIKDIKGGMTLQEALGKLTSRAEIMEAGELAAACENISLAHKHGAGGISVTLENVLRDMEARREYMISGKIKRLENIVTVPLVLSAMVAAITSIAAPFVIMMYGGARSVF